VDIDEEAAKKAFQEYLARLDAAKKIILEYESRLSATETDRTKIKLGICDELKSQGFAEFIDVFLTWDVALRAHSKTSAPEGQQLSLHASKPLPIEPSPGRQRSRFWRTKKAWITSVVFALVILIGIFLAPFIRTLLVNYFSPAVVQNSHFVGEHGNNKKLLIFVHGVIGDMDNTWVNSETHASWPELIRGDQSLGDFDVFVYGYASPAMGDASTIEQISVRFLQELRDYGFFDNYGEVDFITHSMGGIVTKRVLNMLNNQVDSSLLQKVHTVIYISVPSNGADIAGLASWISSNPQFRSMERKSASNYLQGVEGDWGNLLRQRNPVAPFPRNYSAYETLPTGPVQVVPELFTSQLSDGRVMPFDYNHINIVKPKDRDDEVYRWAKARLLEKGTVPSAKR
jgi:pimeloyl-ACP methyl ester carboxylesterase